MQGAEPQDHEGSRKLSNWRPHEKIRTTEQEIPRTGPSVPAAGATRPRSHVEARRQRLRGSASR